MSEIHAGSGANACPSCGADLTERVVGGHAIGSSAEAEGIASEALRCPECGVPIERVAEGGWHAVES
jgi:hypothetical protein